MKFFYLRLLVTGFIFSLISTLVVAQRSNGLAIEGKISVQQGMVEGAYIQMFMDGRRMENYGIGADGQYKVELNYNHKYELVFTLEKNFSQKIVVETTVPKEILQTNPRFPAFPLNINLFTEIPEIDKSFVNNTILKIYYSQSVDNFISELYYNDAQIAKLIEQAVLQSKIVKKESDYLTKLSKAELAEMRKEYNALLEQAGKEYSKEEFLAALDGFKAASRIFPNEQFPKDRIAEINDLLGLMMVAAELDKALAERFAVLIMEADLLFNQKNYSDARNSYNRALSIKPADSYANQQIKAINDLLKKQQTEEQYDGLIAKADNSLKQLLYNEAAKAYQEALSLKPNETYPKSKLQEINGILAEESKNAEKQENYKQAMQQGEIMFQKQFYEKSLASYENALSLKPGDQLATRKIEEVKSIMKGLADKLMYDKLILSADKSFKKELYNEALTDYAAAAVILPDDKYAARRIEEINQKLQTEGNFADLIKNADNQFTAKKYVESKALYTEALKIRSNDKYSLDRVKEIDVLLAAQGVDEKYNAAVGEADRLLSEKNYEDARAKYTEASATKPKETYPKTKIAEIDAIQQQLAKTEQDYQKAISKGDGLMQQKQFEQAILSFTEAGKLKPEEKYPAEMILKANGLIEEQKQLAAKNETERIRLEKEKADTEAARLAAIQTEKDKNYSEAIAKADNLFNQKDYENARTQFRAAQTTKPEETYPQQRITEIGTLMAQLSAAQKAYETAIAKADKEFKAEKFDAAKLAYAEAQKAKPGESYPTEQIAKIDSTVETRAKLAADADAERIRLEKEKADAEAARLAAIQAEKDKNYYEAIAKADNFFNQKDYENARNEYRAAQTTKPDETYPQQRITEIGTLMAQLSAAQKAYETAIAKADKEFKTEKFDAAKLAYTEAQKAKPGESYPTEQIAKIDSTVETRAKLAADAEAERIRLEKEKADAEAARLAAIQAEKDKNYSEAIAKADNLFNQKDYENARTEYRAAQTAKPNETYPQQRIDEIGKTLAAFEAERREKELLDKNYTNLLQQGDRFFTSKTWDQSKSKYQEALKLKPAESYPSERISEIEKILNQQLTDEQYRVIIVAADGFFKTEKYLQANTEYEKALTVKAGEQYPKNQIAKIDDILQKEQQKILSDKNAAEDLQRRSLEIAKLNEDIEARGLASESELNSLYDQFISQADAFFDTRDYIVSRGWYYRALGVKTGEKYPKKRIDEINHLLAGMQNSQLDRDYQKFVDLADSTFRDNQYAVARGWYNRALGVKAAEKYPKDQIKEIENKIAERMAGQSGQQFDNNMQKAATAFETKNFNVARFWYKKALELRPENAEAKNRLKEIDEAMKK